MDGESPIAVAFAVDTETLYACVGDIHDLLDQDPPKRKRKREEKKGNEKVVGKR